MSGVDQDIYGRLKQTSISSSGSTSQKGFLSTHEMKYIDNLSRHEGLKQYYDYIYDGLYSLFAHKKIDLGNLTDNQDTNITEIFEIATKEIPEVTRIFNLDEIEIISQLNSVHQAIDHTDKALVSKYITARIFLNRRTSLQNISQKVIEQSLNDYDAVK